MCDEETTSTSTMLLYLVLSSKRGRERRERVRRLWAGEMGDGGRNVFIVPTVDTEEETVDIRRVKSVKIFYKLI